MKHVEPISTSQPQKHLADTSAAPVGKKEVSYDDEVLWKEFAPSQKDLIFNVALAPTLVWIPFSVAAIGRCAFVKYRITDKRVIVKTEAPWSSAPPTQLRKHKGFSLQGCSIDCINLLAPNSTY